MLTYMSIRGGSGIFEGGGLLLISNVDNQKKRSSIINSIDLPTLKNYVTKQSNGLGEGGGPPLWIRP